MTLIRSSDRPTVDRGPDLPTLQRLVDRNNGSSAMTVLVNQFYGEQQVAAHTHDVEEVLVVTRGTCTFLADGEPFLAEEGDLFIVPPHTLHGVAHAGAQPATVVAVLASPDVTIGKRSKSGPCHVSD